MRKNFEMCLRHVLRHEGGWANHPEDPGGATMKGVTLRVYREHYGDEMTAVDLRRITDKQLATIYRVGYWNPCQCDLLPPGIDLAVFDGAVNSGPRRASRWLQMAVGATPDGFIGPLTLKAVDNQEGNFIAVITAIHEIRMRFLQGLDHWPTFGRGWSRRVHDVTRHASIAAMEGGVA